MRIEQLQYLLKIVETNSFSLAAEQLYLSQQSLSESITKLEQEFNVQLLVRSRKGITLTGYGELFIKDAKDMLNTYDRMLNTCRDETKPLPTNFRIATTQYINASVISHVLPKFRQQITTANISFFQCANSPQILKQVIDHEADLGLATLGLKTLKNAPLFKQHLNTDILAYTLGIDHLYAIVNKNHRLSTVDTMTIESCLDYPLIIDSANQMYSYLATIDKQKPPQVLLTTSDSNTYFSAIAENDALGFTTQRYHFDPRSNDAYDFHLIKLENVAPLQITAIIPTDKQLPTPLKTLIHLIYQSYKD